MMDPKNNVRSDLLKYLRDVHKEHPLKITTGKELMDIFSIDEDTLSFYLRFLVDIGYITLLSKNQNQKALIRITQKGYSKIES